MIVRVIEAPPATTQAKPVAQLTPDAETEPELFLTKKPFAGPVLSCRTKVSPTSARTVVEVNVVAPPVTETVTEPGLAAADAGGATPISSPKTRATEDPAARRRRMH